MYNLKLITTLCLLYLTNLKYITFLTIYVNVLLSERWAPLKLSKYVKTAAADVWLLIGTVCDRKQLIDSTLLLYLFKGNQNLQVMDVCVTYTCLNFVYPCGGYMLDCEVCCFLSLRVQRKLLPVCAFKKNALVY